MTDPKKKLANETAQAIQEGLAVPGSPEQHDAMLRRLQSIEDKLDRILASPLFRLGKDVDGR